jgi:hypothetical protein
VKEQPGFAHLHAAMLRKHVVAIGELLIKKNGAARLVAMSPSKKSFARPKSTGRLFQWLKSPPDGGSGSALKDDALNVPRTVPGLPGTPQLCPRQNAYVEIAENFEKATWQNFGTTTCCPGRMFARRGRVRQLLTKKEF